MNDMPAGPIPPTGAVPATVRATTAGGLLRQARQARGIQVATLAAAIKVNPRKLELLESDRFDELPDATFSRALAQTVCRTLKVDAGPILGLLPPLSGYRLEEMSKGLNTPFRERPGRLVPKEWANVASPALWLAALLVIAAAAMFMVPAGWLPFSKLLPMRAPAQVQGATAVVTKPLPLALRVPEVDTLPASASAREPPLRPPTVQSVKP